MGLIWFLIFFCGFLVFSKTAIKLTKTRIEMIRRKRNAMQKYLRNDIAVLLRDGLDINAYGRVSWFFFFSLSFSFLLILNGLFNFPFWFLIPLSGNRINAFNSPLCVCVCVFSFLSWYYVLFSNWVFWNSKPISVFFLLFILVLCSFFLVLCSVFELGFLQIEANFHYFSLRALCLIYVSQLGFLELEACFQS